MASKSGKKSVKKKGEKKKALKTATKANKNTKKKSKKTKDIAGLEIGSFGKTIVFAVNSEKILTFSDMKREVSARWSMHETAGKRPKTEFIGPDNASVTLTVILDAGLGIRPRDGVKELEKAVNKGTVEYLVIGGKKIGSNKMRITEMSESWDYVYSNGALYRATVELTFEEYVK